jgi:hypothetical protein
VSQPTDHNATAPTLSDEPLRLWQEKLAFLEKEEPLAIGAQKFTIRQQIDEARQKIRELGGEPRYENPETESLSQRLEGLYDRREELTISGDDTHVVDGEILDVRRQLRKGPQLQAGEILADGRFKLVGTLGQGGFATVWKAYDRQRREIVALKVLHGHYSTDRSKRERFFRGARKMAELRHANVVRVLEPEIEDEGWLRHGARRRERFASRHRRGDAEL